MLFSVFITLSSAESGAENTSSVFLKNIEMLIPYAPFQLCLTKMEPIDLVVELATKFLRRWNFDS